MSDLTCYGETKIIDIASGRYLNESAIKDHALACSKKFRAGKFTRCGVDFIDEIKADVEAVIRELRNKHLVKLHDPLETELVFTTGALCDKIQPELNAMVSRIIQNKVQVQPSCGRTLGRTR
jgi:hypothetical protein